MCQTRVLGSFPFPQGRGIRREIAGSGGIESEAASGVLK